jgi:Family of unknown function (DUF6069)
MAISSVRRRRALIAFAAMLAPVLVWVVARIAGADLSVALSGQPPMPITLPAVIITALLAALAGWALLAVLERFTGRARLLWTAVAALVLLVSLSGPLTVAASGGTKLTLVLMHLAVGVVLIPGLRATTGATATTGTGEPATAADAERAA